MKIAPVFISLLLIMFACRPSQKIQKTTEVITKVDTTPVALAKDNKIADSTDLIKEVYNKVLKNKINFTTFNSKARVAYNSEEGNNEATAYIRVKKDSIIWISLRGPLGIEGFRVLITKDSVKVINLLKKNVQYQSIGFLRQFTGIPFDYPALQDLIVGNPVFVDSNVTSYSTDSSHHLQVLMQGTFFKNTTVIDNTDYKILNSKLDDINTARNRTCTISYDGYDSSSGIPFSTQRKISVRDQSKFDINLDFKQYGFNQSVTFPFNVPVNYKTL